MSDLTTPEGLHGSASETLTAGAEKRRNVAVAILVDKATKKYPDGPPPPKAADATTPTDPLALIRQLNADPNPHFEEDTADTEHNLIIDSVKGTDLGGQNFDHKGARVIGVSGANENGLLCTLANEDGPIMDSRGKPLVAPIPEGEVILSIAKAYTDNVTEALKDDGDANMAVQEIINPTPGASPDTLLSDDAIAKLAEQYGVKDAEEPLEATQPEESKEIVAIKKMNVVITEKINELLAKAANEKLSTEELKLLANLRVALPLDGETLGLNFKADVLRLAGMTAEVTKIDPEGTLVDASEKELGRLLTEFKNNGQVTQEQLDAWGKIAAKDGGMFLLMQDPDFQKVLLSNESEICKGLFGKDMTEAALKKLLTDANLPPELQAAIESGDKMSILKILLLIAAGVVAAPLVAMGGAALAAGQMVGSLGSNR